MKRQSTLIAIGVFVTLIVAAFLWVEYFPGDYEFNGSTFEPLQDAYRFDLVDANGAAVRLADMDGKVVLIFFGYTHCPDVCPTTLADYQRMHEELGKQAGKTAFVFITVDPDRDTPERVQEYVQAFDPAIIGLSGTLEQLKPIWDGYFVKPEYDETDQAGNYFVSHSSRIYVVDKSGKLHLTFPGGTSVAGMLADIRYLVAD